jgi:hypothetical protein
MYCFQLRSVEGMQICCMREEAKLHRRSRLHRHRHRLQLRFDSASEDNMTATGLAVQGLYL